MDVQVMIQWIDLNLLLLMAKIIGLYTDLGDMTFEKCNMILKLIEQWLLLDNSMNMCEILSGIYELAMKAIVIINMQEKVLKTYC